MTSNKQINQYILLSIAAACLVVILVFYGVSNTGTNLNIRLFVGLTFITSCIFGMFFAKYPGWIKRIFKNVNHNISPLEKVNKKKVKYEGHHPNCNKFENHTIIIYGKKYCAGCFSLALGSVLSILLMVFYIVFLPRFFQIIYYILIFLGLGIIFLCFIEIKISKRNSIFHVFLNNLFVVSFFLIIVGVLEITGELLFGFVAIVFAFLWLDTRAQLSFWQHARICADCNKNCKMY